MSEHTPTKTPTRRRRTPTEVAGHRLLRPLEGSHATWEIPSDDPKRMQLLVLGRARKGQERSARTAFHRQLRARMSLLHPHLAAIVGGGESPRGPYVVVSLPRARPLSSLIADGPLDPARAHGLLTGVADALDAAHTRWLIHTDLTPRAVFVEPGSRDWAWLTDFGIAHNRPPLAFARAGYRSPEELRGEPPLPESNVYSLACVVYTCLSGSAPFARQSSRAAMEAQLHETPPLLTELRPELPAAIDDVLASALSKSPDARQRSAGALLLEVGEALGVVDKSSNGGRRNGSGRFRRRGTAETGRPSRRDKPVPLNGAPAQAPAKAPERSRHAPSRSTSTGQAAPAPARPKAAPPPPKAAPAAPKAAPAAPKVAAPAPPTAAAPAPPKAAPPRPVAAPATPAPAPPRPAPAPPRPAPARPKVAPPARTKAAPKAPLATPPAPPVARPKKAAPTGRPERKRTTPIESLPPRKPAGRRGAPPAVLIPILLLAVAGAGVAGWTVGSSDSSSTPPVDPGTRKAERDAAAQAKAAAGVEQTRVAWLGSANDAVETLSSRRSADRRRLASARTPGDQAARGRRLARSYALARRALGDPPESVPRAAALGAALRGAESAYERLARSARRGNRSAYRRAVDRVRSAERDVDRALERLGEPA